MKTALIGHTGFVGSNLKGQFLFDDLYNTSNISEIQGKEYDLVICAGVKSVKWWANQNPKEDLIGIQDLTQYLNKVNASKFILISTVDVYPNPKNVNEDFDFSSINQDTYQAYGKNRLYLENFIKNNFKDYHIIRLPGLFGDNIKKNVIFDLLNNNQTNHIIPNCKFQYYFLGNIWKDINIVLENKIKEINFNSEAIETVEIVGKFFQGVKIGEQTDNPTIYDYKTKFDSIFGGKNGYLYSKEQVLKQFEYFITNYKKTGN